MTAVSSAATTNQYSALTASTANDATTLAASRAKASATTSLGQSDFLKLMTTQMTHQDPNNPMTNGDFLSQMAQFGTVSGIQDLQKSFATFSSAIQSAQSMQATSLVGHDVSVTSKQGVLAAGGDIVGAVTLPSSATDVTVAITDSTGALVKTI